MATNENVNKVIYGNQTIMDITDTTAEESDVASGKAFYKANGERSVGTLNKDSAVWGNISGTLSDQTDLQTELNRAYSKTASETSSLDDLDLIPVQKISASSDGGRNIKFRNLKQILTNFFDTVYQTILTLPLSTANGGTGNADGYIRTGLRTGTTIGNYSTIEGGNNRSPGNYAHSEGSFCGAEGSCSHAEGSYTTASGIHSHSEGAYTSARGENSHAEGQNTIAEYKNQHVQGVYNDNKSTTLFEVGNGASSSNRSNAFEVYSDGHINVNGDIHQNGKLYNDKATQGLLKSTVGWTGKNVLPNNFTNQTINGVTCTKDENGIINLNGTCTGVAYRRIYIGNIPNGTYIISDNVQNHNDCNLYINATKLDGTTAYGIANSNGKPLNADNTLYKEYDVGLYFKDGIQFNDLKVYPMLRDASITDDTYEPYHESVEEEIEQIYADNGVLGAKNLIENTLTDRTIFNITATVNSDKQVTLNGTQDGSSADSSDFVINGVNDRGKRLKLSNYPSSLILSAGINVPSTLTVGIWFYDASENYIGLTSIPTGDSEVYVNIPSNAVYFIPYVRVNKNQTVNNITVSYMLRLASDPDDTYVPYAMTNRELTETINNISPALITSPMPSYVANSLPVRKKNITNDFYNGSLRAEIAAGNFKNVRPGDYIIGQSSGSTYYVACLDYRLGKGDKTNNANYPAYGTHHLGLMLFKHNGPTRLWAGYGNADKSWRVSANEKGRCPWNAEADVDPTNSEAIGTNNTNITRQYNSANVSGYMGSFIRERIDAIILTEDFIADFGSANVLKYREINGNAVATDKPSGGQGNWNGCTSGRSWYDRFLDLPSEIELYGSRVFGSAYDIGCQCEQLPFLRNASIHDFFPRIDIWTKAVASDSNVAYRYSDGYATANVASRALLACPLACVK